MVLLRLLVLVLLYLGGDVVKFSRFLFFLFFVVVLFSAFSFVGAVDDESEAVENVLSTELEDTSSDVGVFSDLGAGGILSDGVSSPDDFTLTSVRVLRSVAPVEPANDGSLKSVFLSLIGSYDPIVLEYEYTSQQGYTSYLREVQLDYPWLASAFLFIVVLWCVFKIGGRVIWNK